jgi:glycerate kinase
VGAAGGVGYAFVAFLGRRLTSGIELLLDIVGLDAALEGASLVVTGEGRIDEQTLMGKAPVGVLRRAQRRGVPCVAVGGMVAMSESLAQSGFSDILAAKPSSMPLSEAMMPSVAYDNLRAVGRGVASAYSKK